ncbi:autotransporter outer membrane beta-barrel domain-containing protein [Oricola sp.]|uniref:autotransporter outer membrane beta-barrel domain-containing protein n=1 Tax=Oricola sp. TaxID=1979950 RepID=UPI0025F73809|nr:autotransporter outer membrane beta-barrel domain-containing protein [Oricola sp.]MCI5076913.1 autotransporter outer membrane beta-barrel domain-containing protein [Oricola sp.]
MLRCVRVLTDRLIGWSGSLLAAAVLAASLIIAAAPSQAANEGCSSGDCTDVPVAGIRYVNTGVSTVDVADGTPGTTTVNSGVIGIHLEKTGQDAPSVPDVIEFTLVAVDHDNNSNTDKVLVVADSDGTPLKPGGEYIFRTGTDSYELGSTTYTSDELLMELYANSVVVGGSVSGSLTVNNPGSNPGSGASFSTTNANGIQVRSKGGKGSNGGCTTILLATWCDSGDRGGNAGSVAVNNDGAITVNGSTQAYGILAVSEGGQGGNGGGSFGLFASDAGSGGDGGDGADVTVTLGVNSDITTHGASGHGVFAQSVGGNGGSGGSPSGAVALGDAGGNGGDAGVVTVTNDGSILTTGEAAYGIYARSMGAGAGNGSGSGGLVAIGGNGGGESSGNKVTVNNTGNIETTNVDSIGIYAQSVGGGGGNGGGAGGLFSVGGKGGSGGNANDVAVTSSGSITTAQSGSTGVFAQSIGGGGGNGGYAVAAAPVVSVGIGGDGGLGGDGKKVTVNLNTGSDIDVSGAQSRGVLAQSIGGGGGNGGYAVALAAPVPTIPISASFAIGGDAGGGGEAGEVEVNTAAGTSIATAGEDAAGILAQSIGGGGGNGGMAISGAIGTVSVSVGVGGSGGGGGDSDAVSIDNNGTITTDGVRSKGIFAQSIGGGGGNGGNSIAASLGAGAISVGVGGGGGTAGDVKSGTLVTVDNSGAITTNQADSHGIHAQSIGGGGGSGGSAISAAFSGGPVAGSVAVGIGGDGGGGGSGQGVRVTNSGEIHTKAARSYGIAAQSIGGGGGDGGFAVAAAVSISEKLSVSIGVPVGGSGGDAGTGSWVEVANSNAITTEGDLSHAILAQSVGGGGGSGGAAISVPIAIGTGSSGAVGVAIGGGGGSGGTAASVDVSNASTIVTMGSDANGIRAQSIGGGGGNGGFGGSFGLAIGGNASASASIAIGGAGGTGNYAGAVSVENEGDITTGGDRSSAIYAESIGGGGGSGGGSATLAGTFSAAGAGLSASVAVGGAGGDGNDGAVVQVTSDGNITTGAEDGSAGYMSHGIHATSIGGGGGTGGFAASISATASEKSGGAISVSVGGSGGDGGIGRNVGVGVALNDTDIVDNTPGASYGDVISVDPITGTIVTHGSNAHGILAESIGGGGGDGGFAGAFSAAVNTSEKKSLALSVAVGGAGGSGGHAGDVIVNNAAAITANGVNSNGIAARSIGGGGGNGGGSLAGAFGAKESITLNVAVGGSGGTGNGAGDVDVTNSGDISLTYAPVLYDEEADEAPVDTAAIFAQSISGGGGNGGFAFSTSIGGPENRSLNVSVGGAGGDAAPVGSTVGGVMVDNSGTLSTNADRAHGIFGQSIGGSGGNGGFAAAIGVSVIPPTESKWVVNASVAVGGSGGTGNYGGTVELANTGEITTHGDNAHAIYGQSIGGGGGNGGLAYSGNIGLGDGEGKSFQAAVSVGGNGGDGNHGGYVEIDNDNSLETFGDMANGIVAQSIGGGGGAGGGANALNVLLNAGNFDPFSKFSTSNLKLEIAVGGSGGGGENDGGEVFVDNDGDITTHGDQSRGIWAQSIGGGGGAGGGGALSTGFPEGDLAVAVATCLPCNLPNIVDPTDLSVIVGGDAGASGDGKKVTVANAAAITTDGNFSHAIYAQSIGGGGGEAVIWSKLEDPEGRTDEELEALNGLSDGGAAAIGPNGKFGIGGAGGAAGDGGEVIVTMSDTASLETFGDEAHGIIAQSIGGGGGTSGSIDRTLPNPQSLQAITGVTDLPNVGLGLGFARDGGNAGDGGNVTITSEGDIVTHGSSSMGIFAQSIGGGGGLAGGTGIGPTISVFAGSVGGDGSAGKVSVGQTGDITTSGYAAHGIFAQSAGGGKDTYVGYGDDVTVSLDGTIDTSGQNAIGVFAQSIGVDGAGDITVTLAEGSKVSGGTLVGLDTDVQPETAAGIRLMDGVDNLVTNRGEVTTADGVDGYAMVSTGGIETVDNFGTMTGSFDLGDGANGFTNEIGSTLNSGLVAKVGTGNTLSNAGTVAPGGEDRVMTTSVTGIYEQTDTGTFSVDLDLALTSLTPPTPREPNETDVILASQEISVNGMVDLSLMNIGNVLPGEHQALLARSDTTLTDFGIELSAPASAVATYGLTTTSTDLLLDYAVDFSPEGLNANQTSLGDYINDFQLAGGSESLEPVVEALFNIPDLEGYAPVLDQLTPEPFVESQIAALYASMDFEESLLSCRVANGPHKFNAEGECMWVAGVGGETHRESDFENLGWSSSEYSSRFGAQGIVSDHVRVGFGGMIGSMNGKVGEMSENTGQRFQAGAAIKGVFGGTTIAGTFTGGYDIYEVVREVELPNGPNYTLESSPEYAYAAAHARLSHTIGGSSGYLRPSMDVGVTWVRANGFTEEGDSPVALIVEEQTQRFVTIAPSLEIGGEFRATEQTVVRPFASIGYIGVPLGSDPGISAAFVGAPASVDPFTVYGDADSAYLDLKLGFDVVSEPGMSFRALATAQIGETTQDYSGSMKLAVPF